MSHRYAVLMAFLFAAAGVRSEEGCLTSTQVASAPVARTVIIPGKELRRLQPSFFGFNLEWLEFQNGLWDTSTGQVRAEAVSQLKVFQGAVYRYPGGHHANHLDWHDAIGPMDQRPLRRQVSWLPPLKALFGPHEYLQFVQQVQGEPWYVANLQGRLREPRPPEELATEAGELARYFRTQAEKGLPAVTRWELGNELDRSDYRWPPDRLAQAAQLVAAAIAAASPKARFVHLQQEYPAMADRGFTAERYNQSLRKDLAALGPAYAMHAYYDGPPAGPPVSYFLRQICKVVDSAKAEGRAKPEIWLTEHARVPAGAFVQPDWKRLWPGTSDLQAALSVADMTLALASIPEVQGAFVHALHASTGPWPMWRRRPDGRLDPTAPLQALSMIRRNILPVVVGARQSSPSDEFINDTPAVRTLVMRTLDSGRYAVLAVNRSRSQQSLEILDYPVGMKISTLEIVKFDGIKRAEQDLPPAQNIREGSQDRRILRVNLPPQSLVAVSIE